MSEHERPARRSEPIKGYTDSDRGSQYISIPYTERLVEAGTEPSLGSKGDSYDRALVETINGRYKVELFVLIDLMLSKSL